MTQENLGSSKTHCERGQIKSWARKRTSREISSHATRLGFVSRIGQENVQVAAIVTDGAMLRAPPLTTTRHCFAISAGA
jgi:hypothetical protein